MKNRIDTRLRKILARAITRDTHKGSTNRVIHTLSEDIRREIFSDLEKSVEEFYEDTTKVAGYPEGYWVEAVPLEKIKEILL